jgi:hypothetical protein
MLIRTALGLVTCATLALAISCGGGASSTKATPSLARATPVSSATTPSGAQATPPLATPAPEHGQGAIFWRTTDNFASMQAGQPYKVVFRIANGFAEQTLPVTAACTSCPPAERQPLSFQGGLVEPVGGEAPGSFYAMNITLPYAGRWEIDVIAGGDTAKIMVDVAAGASTG